MNVVNATDGRHLALPMKDRDGYDRLVVVLTYTFHADARGHVELLREDAAEPCLADECHDEDPATSSIRRPSDLFDFKPGTDVILVGHAHALRPDATHSDVTLRVGPIDKTIRAHGLRVWQAGAFGGLSPGPALAMREPVPLRYELAWGGWDLSDPKKPALEPRNPLGRGVARHPAQLVGTPAAQLEDPKSPIGSRRPAVACFGAIHRHWEPRCSFAGTYDQAWMDARMPLLPADFDPRFHVAVPPDQWSLQPLRSDTPIEVLGATADGVWHVQLPRVAPGFRSLVAGQRRDHPTHLDRIWVDADARQVQLTYRASMPVPLKLEQVEEVRIFEKQVVR